MAVTLTTEERYSYSTHGWSDTDMTFIEDNAQVVHSGRGWVLSTALAPDGVLWVYPASNNNVFPISLWKLIRDLILAYPAVVIPMDQNQDAMTSAAKRYNGYLQDNLFMFGDKLKGVKLHSGGKKWFE